MHSAVSEEKNKKAARREQLFASVVYDYRISGIYIFIYDFG